MMVQFLELCTKFGSNHSLNGSSDSANSDLHIYLFIYLYLFSSETRLQVRPVDGF